MADRVPAAQAIARAGLRLAAAFAIGAAVVAALGGPRWIVVHLFAAGAGASAISGVGLHLAVTWSAAPPPSPVVVALQRWALGAGVVAVVLGRHWDSDVTLAIGTAAVSSSLILLAAVLVWVDRRAPHDRYRIQVRAYAAAACVAALGAAAGGVLALGHVVAPLWRAHPIVMVWGLLGLVVAATAPTFAAMTMRSRPSPRLTSTRLGGVVVAVGAGTVVAATAALWDLGKLAGVGFGAIAAGFAGAVALLPAMNRRTLRFAGPRAIGLVAALAWFSAVAALSGFDATRGTWPTGGHLLVVLAVGGLAQVLWAAVAYLAPVLRGGGPASLAAGFALTRSWVALLALNAAAVAVLADSRVAGPLLAVAAVDTVARLALLSAGRLDRLAGRSQ